MDTPVHCESDDDYNIQFAAINSFAMANTDPKATFTFDPNNGTNAAGGRVTFERYTNGLDTIRSDVNTDTPTGQTLADWTDGASSINIFGTSSPTANLRHLVYSFETVAVPEPSRCALFAGMLGLTSIMLRRRRQ